MNTEQKQGFKSLSIVGLFGIGILTILSLAPMWRSEASTKNTQAMLKAEALAYQIFEGRKSAARGPASVGSLNHLNQEEGEVGLDPWGNQYRFKIFGNGDSESHRILVWSMGPNSQFDSTSQVIEHNKLKESPEFLEDDVGVIITIK